MLHDVKSSVFFLHTCIVTTDTLISRVQFDLGQRDCDNRFSTWLFDILVCLFLFVFFTIYCRSCYEGALKKKLDVKWLPFFNILENLSTFSEKKKNSVGFIFWSVLYELLFRGLCVVVLFGFDIACILVTRPSFRAKLFFPGFLRNSRKISSR